MARSPALLAIRIIVTVLVRLVLAACALCALRALPYHCLRGQLISYGNFHCF
jgi:hypothetical protein